MRIVKKIGQVSIEYLMIIGFVSFAVVGVLFIAFIYSGSSEDRIKNSQIEALTNKLINSAESVYFSGSPSQATISVYVPKSINLIEINNPEDGISKEILVISSSHSGEQRRVFASNVNIKFEMDADTLKRFASEGNKNIKLIAHQDYVEILMV